MKWTYFHGVGLGGFSAYLFFGLWASLLCAMKLRDTRPAAQTCAMDLVSIVTLAHNTLVVLSEILYLILKFAVTLW
jgi:hypothetical protein